MSKYDGLSLPDGLTRPYRPKPADFREVYIRNGWDGAEGPLEDIYNTNWRVIRRWIFEEGEEELKAERRAFVEGQWAERRILRKRYILGRTLHPVGKGSDMTVGGNTPPEPGAE